MEADVELVEPEAGRGKLLDASADGLRVAIDRLVRVGDVHLAVLRTRQGQEHRDRVRVVWTRPRDGSGCTAGLAFLER